MKKEKKEKIEIIFFLFCIIFHIPLYRFKQILPKMSNIVESSEQTLVKKTVSKRRTSEEVLQANQQKKILQEAKKQEQETKKQEKQKKKEEQEAKKQEHSSILQPGIGPDAVSAIKIIATCVSNANKTDNAFRRMIASRVLFPPKKNINKFMTGGCAEEIVTQLISSVGFTCHNVSDEATVIDLEVDVPIVSDDAKANHSFKVSLKNSCNISSSPILENYRGKKRDEIRPLPPTFIIYTEVDKKCVRIIYLDHEIIKQGYPLLTDAEVNAEVFKNDDACLTFKSGFLKKFIPRLPREYILNGNYPEDLSFCKEQNIVKLALAEVDRQIGNIV